MLRSPCREKGCDQWLLSDTPSEHPTDPQDVHLGLTALRQGATSRAAAEATTSAWSVEEKNCMVY